jgi:hypothetical protein
VDQNTLAAWGVGVAFGTLIVNAVLAPLVVARTARKTAERHAAEVAAERKIAAEDRAIAAAATLETKARMETVAKLVDGQTTAMLKLGAEKATLEATAAEQVAQAGREASEEKGAVKARAEAAVVAAALATPAPTPKEGK